MGVYMLSGRAAIEPLLRQKLMMRLTTTKRCAVMQCWRECCQRLFATQSPLALSWSIRCIISQDSRKSPWAQTGAILEQRHTHTSLLWRF
jgi:hypothetical protein